MTKPGFSFTTRRGHFVAKVGYSYSVRDTIYQGLYKRECPTEHGAHRFARDLAGRAVTIRRSPTNPSQSQLLEHDVEEMLQRRPAAVVEWARAESSVPEWLRPFLWVFIWLSCVGLVVSLWVHLGAVMGRRVAPEPYFWILHIGIFVVWFPAVFVAQRLVGNMNRKDLWKVILKDSPTWMRYMVYGFMGYAMVNFLLFMMNAPSGHGGGNPPAEVWRGFSGHWMAFYSAALAILYAATQRNQTPKAVVPGRNVE